MNYHYHEQAVPLDKENDFEAMECLQQLVESVTVARTINCMLFLGKQKNTCQEFAL